MGTCEKCGREIKNFGVLSGGVRCPNDCSSGRDIPKTIKPTSQGKKWWPQLNQTTEPRNPRNP